jgi:hypothetical protein
MPVARHPPHRSQRAELPHWAPTSGRTRKSLLGPWVANRRCRQVSSDQIAEPVPVDTTPLTPPAEHLTPSNDDLIQVARQRAVIAGDAVVLVVATQYLSEPSPCQRFAKHLAVPRRMTRGQIGRYSLICKALSFSTFCRHMASLASTGAFPPRLRRVSRPRRSRRELGRLEEVAATRLEEGGWIRHLRWVTRGGSAGVEGANET